MSMISCQIAASVFLFLVLLANNSCTTSQPVERYLVKGLSLPLGAEEVDYDSEQNEQGLMIRVQFNCPAGWEAVASHFDDILLKEGFEDPMVRHWKDQQDHPNYDKLVASHEEFLAMQRLYRKQYPSRKVNVQLVNVRETNRRTDERLMQTGDSTNSRSNQDEDLPEFILWVSESAT